MTVMDKGFSDEAIVGVKLIANEDAVTYLRTKLSESDKEVGAGKRRLRKGGTCNMESKSHNSSCFEFSHRNFL